MTRSPSSRSWLRASLCLLLAFALGGAAMPASAEDAPSRKAFRVCKDPNNPPFTDARGEGFEDKIAALFAAKLGLPVETYTFPQRLGFVRNTLRYKLPGKDYPCDIVMGVPADFGQLLPTKPYYRSTYVLVIAPGKGLDGVRSEEDFLALPPDKLAGLKIAVFDRSPGSAWLARHNLVDSGVPYKTMNPNPDEVPGELIARDLASGAIDVAVMWGPIGSYTVRQAKDIALRVVPLASEPGVKFDYEMAMGVRFGEKAWKQQIETLIEENQAEIANILKQYGVPLITQPVVLPLASPELVRQAAVSR
ncbi:quinoprotein dehydrogenase-associated putative ABC transporter substrate-binding protein [Azoarcus sp. KH32C]|uniref:quinoprotein dehydrogenase-associated putative ABC transporter substrate-binding protein n=1 Tax=Azoarcus sp. KH32C TaxID=748247 RepID=UPI0002385DD6|nr:quinoprotein dehydrogenase-associated putative ABC transporter substrate-binding protein [Azoarcus sp. KH32C]BAL27140.1 MxaJ protein [Azoarcus sp. KH32C]